MPPVDVMGPGWWLDPDTNKVYPVDRHERWLTNPENLRKVRLRQEIADKILALDPERDANEMRMLACQGGLIRIRDYSRRLSVEFYAPRYQVTSFLWSVFQVLSDISRTADAMLTITNLYNNDHATIWRRDFVAKLKADEPVLRRESVEVVPDIGVIPQSLRESVDRLLGESPGSNSPVSLKDAAFRVDRIRNDRSRSVEEKVSELDTIGGWLATQSGGNTKFLMKLLSEVHHLRDSLTGGTGKGGVRIEFQ